MQWGTYLHRVRHVVICCIIDAGEEILTQLQREEPGCSATPKGGCSCLRYPGHRDFYFFTPKARAPEC